MFQGFIDVFSWIWNSLRDNVFTFIVIIKHFEIYLNKFWSFLVWERLYPFREFGRMLFHFWLWLIYFLHFVKSIIDAFYQFRLIWFALNSCGLKPFFGILYHLMKALLVIRLLTKELWLFPHNPCCRRHWVNLVFYYSHILSHHFYRCPIPQGASRLSYTINFEFKTLMLFLNLFVWF